MRVINELTVYQQSGLPAQPSELAKFILILPEKIKAMKAEIMAIQKAQLAKEVYDQKKDELDRVRELMLLAYARMGAITSEIPKGSGGDRKSEDFKIPSSGNFEKTKAQAIKDLGFSSSQVGRMEQMAAHPDIVEEVIAESQTGQTEATQGEVLRRIKERNKVIDLTEVRENNLQSEMQQIDQDYENLKHFRKVTCFIDSLYEVTPEILDSVAVADSDLNRTIKRLEEATRLLITIRSILQERRVRRGKKPLYERD